MAGVDEIQAVEPFDVYSADFDVVPFQDDRRPRLESEDLAARGAQMTGRTVRRVQHGHGPKRRSVAVDGYQFIRGEVEEMCGPGTGV